MPSGWAKLDQRFQALPDRFRSRDPQTEEDAADGIICSVMQLRAP